MSSPASYTWSDVIDNFLSAVKNVLYEIGDFIVNNASAIAEAMLGIGLAYAVYRGVTRVFPMIRRIFALGL